MTALGVLCCFALFVCVILLVSFFLPSHLSFKNMYSALCTSGAFDIHVQYTGFHTAYCVLGGNFF